MVGTCVSAHPASTPQEDSLDHCFCELLLPIPFVLIPVLQWLPPSPRAVTGLPCSGWSAFHHSQGLLLSAVELGSGISPRNLREGQGDDLPVPSSKCHCELGKREGEASGHPIQVGNTHSLAFEISRAG